MIDNVLVLKNGSIRVRLKGDGGKKVTVQNAPGQVVYDVIEAAKVFRIELSERDRQVLKQLGVAEEKAS